MTTDKTEANAIDMRTRIVQAVNQLERSDRGCEIANQLYDFLDGAFSGADALNAAAVQTLLEAASSGCRGTVMDCLGDFADDDEDD